MLNIEIYTKNWCPYCHQAKALLRGKRVSYREIDATTDSERELDQLIDSTRLYGAA